MSVMQYEENGSKLWKMYINVRSKRNQKIRIQKLIHGIRSEAEAQRLEKKWTQWAFTEVARSESDGLTWLEVVEAWELWYKRYPTNRWDPSTVRDYVSLVHNWTSDWLDKPVGKITVSDGFEMIQKARDSGASAQRLYQIKSTVNVIFKWGMQSGKIVGKDHSPLFAVDLPKKEKEKEPEILNLDQFKKLLDRAKSTEHEWYPIWKVDAHTGLRASELEGLRKEDIELIPRSKALTLDQSTDPNKSYGSIRVLRQWKKKEKTYGPLKGRYWRTVPISSQLYWFLEEYIQNDFGKDEHGHRVFPVFQELRRGNQAKVLKLFCASQKLKVIKFHTLRACFATHLLAAGVAESKVMKIGGWKDRDTMMIYVRLAGIDEAGATEALDLSPEPAVEAEVPYKNVVNIFSRR
jgi:integrase